MKAVIRCKAKDLKTEIDKTFKARGYHIELRVQHWTVGKPEPENYLDSFKTFEQAFNTAVEDHIKPALLKGWRVDQEFPPYAIKAHPYRHLGTHNTITQEPTFQWDESAWEGVPDWEPLVEWLVEDYTGDIYEVLVFAPTLTADTS